MKVLFNKKITKYNFNEKEKKSEIRKIRKINKNKNIFFSFA